MGADSQALEAWNEVAGQQKPEEVGIGEWIWRALQGDFNEDRTAGQIGFDMVVSLIPIVDTICDIRDVCANIQNYRKDPSNKITLFFIATTAIGFIPEAGTVVKSALRIVWVYLRPLLKRADDISNASKLAEIAGKAIDAALPKITEYLQHNRIAQFATKGKIPDLYKFVAKQITNLAGIINPTTIKKYMNVGIDTLVQLLKKIQHIVPSHIRDKIRDLLTTINTHRKNIVNSIEEFATPIRIILRVLAKKLNDHAWRVHIQQTNRGWIAPLSETGAAKLINANPPKWVKKVRAKPHPEMDPIKGQSIVKTNPDYPQIDNWIIETFSSTPKRGEKGFRPDKINGPATLYRVVDPSNEAAGIFWITEKEYKALRNRDEWRERFAVKPDWNQNGWVVKYELKEKEEINVWRGPAASQKLEGTDYHLVGGHEQIVFFPTNRDVMVQAHPRIDSNTGLPVKDSSGNLDRRVEYTDVTGEIVPTKLRSEITDPRIKGPIETGWGTTDYTAQEAKRILLTVP